MHRNSRIFVFNFNYIWKIDAGITSSSIFKKGILREFNNEYINNRSALFSVFLNVKIMC